MKKTTLFLALLAFASGAFAEETPAKLALAREVISALQADKMIDGMMGQLKQMAAQTSNVPTTATPEQRAKAEKLQTEIMELSMNSAKKLIGQMDQLYAEIYSETDLKAMKGFFTSPEGRSMISKQPQLMQRMMPMMQQMQQELQPQIQSLVAASKAADASSAPAPAAKTP
ncbi:MAG: DUF2059 domain-containing protein [Opitutus sp.]